MNGSRARRWRQLRSPTLLVGLAIVLFWVLTAVFWPLLTPYNPTTFQVSAILTPPSWQHPFGTDQFGRDVLARVLAGSRDVLLVAPAATLVGIVTGTVLGLFTGYSRGALSEALMRLMDAAMAFPVIILALLILSSFGASLVAIVLVIGFVYTPYIARVVRSAVLSVRDLNYVSAARLRGESPWYVMRAEILTNVRGPIVVEGTVRVGYAVFASAGLSFLGLGLPPPSADWGLQIADARTSLLIAPWLALFPALAIATLVVGINLVSDGLRRGVLD
jgi:peptide/nickel transport system permease protein